MLPQSLVMGQKLVAQNYLRGWFTLDVVSSFPIDLVLFGKRSDLWRLPRLLKVLNNWCHMHCCPASSTNNMFYQARHVVCAVCCRHSMGCCCFRRPAVSLSACTCKDCLLHALQVIRVLHNKTLAKAAHDIKRLKILSDISQFDAQILKLTTYVFLWIHWNACLQYGSCVAQPDSR